VIEGAPPERLTGGVDLRVYGLLFAGPGLPQRWSAPLVAWVPAQAERYDALRQESAVATLEQAVRRPRTTRSDVVSTRSLIAGLTGRNYEA
jgi:hypothetical protein